MNWTLLIVASPITVKIHVQKPMMKETG